MGSRDRDTKSLHDKLKVLFKKGGSAPVAAQNELVVTPELRRELSSEVPLHRRLRAIKELCEKVLHIRVQEGGVEKIWSTTRDLLEEPSTEARHAALGLLRCIAEGQTELLIMRTILFRYLQETRPSHHPEDYQLRFKLLHTLTNTGKDIKCFEEEIGPFLLEWLPQLPGPAQIIDFVQLITNVVKFNAVYLDEEIVHGIVNNACHLCVYSAEAGVVQGCLALLEAVLSYSLLPRAALRTFVAALCRTVNLEHYCQNSWKLMRYVVGADMGHAALQAMVDMVREAGEVGGAGAEGEGDAGLARGAVFYINMALWGPRRVLTLHVSHLAVLPAFLKALNGRQPVVTYEVVVALQSLVSRAPLDLHEVSWDVLLRIVREILDQDKTLEPPNELIHKQVHALITSIEQLQEAGQFQGDPDALLDLLDYCGHDRPEASTMRVITLRGAMLGGCGEAGAALALAERYLRLEPRLPVRLHTLHTVLAYIRRASVGGDEALERVGAALAAACAGDAECALRAAAARALPVLARACSADAAIDLVDQLEKILNRPFEMYVSDVPIPAEADTSDLAAAAGGLLELLHERLLRAPAAPAARALLVLLDHLDLHYRRPALCRHHPDIRLKIFDMLFGLRANASNCVGFCYDSRGACVWGAAALRVRPTCSPFLLAEPPLPRGAAAPPPPRADLPPGACVIPVGRFARLLTLALTRESEWGVLAHVLRALPQLLTARALVLGRRAHDIDQLAATLCSMVSDRSATFPECSRANSKLLVSEFHAAVLPPLAAMASYNAYLEPNTQRHVVRCLLKHGMVLRTPQPYINALTLFTLETRETMVRMLPEVLLDLSKISDTQAIASPMLEFLSTLTRLPRVFASFVEDQYMSVFAILLPYTNPSRYNHYVVSLAHHVIAAWFLKCRLSYRRNFVRFIIHGLHNYIIMPFEEQLQCKTNNFHQNSVNEDSSNRQRSSSLGSKAVSRAPLAGRGGGSRGGAGSGAGGGAGGGGSSAPAAFHVELTETCVDLLARYTFTPCSVKPQRSDTAEFLFKGGQSTTWLVGHKLVTITTSGCLQNSIKQGLCERCASLCRQHAESAASPLPGAPAPPAPPAPTAPPAPADLPPQVQIKDSSESNSSSSNNHLQVNSHGQNNQPEVKRYSKWSLQHSRSTETSCSSLSISELQPPSSGHVSRQNSSENKSTDPLAEVLNQFTQRIERISKEVESEEGLWWRVGGLAEAGACPCWCARWAQLHVRSPTGDVSWLLRMQNHINSAQLQEWPLQDVLALLSPPLATGLDPGAALGTQAAHASQASHAASATDLASEESSRSSRSQHAADLHKSSSDTVVAGERRAPAHSAHQPARMSTQPINIPGSPQRQSSSSTTGDDDMLLIVPEGKSRHPVRRSNSSPEMSSSWKVPVREPAPPDDELAPNVDEMILLPVCEPTSTSMTMHANKKAAKKSDMRVSCEAIPEETGTSPQPHHVAPHNPQVPQNQQVPLNPPVPHNSQTLNQQAPVEQPQGTQNHHKPHLITYNSDPGAVGSDTEVDDNSNSDGLNVVHVHHQLQKTSSDSTVTTGAGGAGAGGAARDELPPLARSKRSNTISVMSPTERARYQTARDGAARANSNASSGGGGGGSAGAGGAGGGVSPSFVFLQLYHNMSTYPISPPVPGEVPTQLSAGCERPLKVCGAQHERTLKNIDLMPPLETYKVGVLYVGPGQQDDEVAILKNEYGSVRYSEFLRALGTLVPLEGADEPNLFLNLEKGGKDGRYTYVWTDDIMQVQFHVATAMPSCARDPHCNEKRKYIGNDFVSIVYNDSGHDFNILTIKGQFNLCVVVVEPMECGMSRVLVKTKDERIRSKFLAHLQPTALSDTSVPLLARQQALHCALASQISQSLETAGGQPYASNCLERLRLIKRLRARIEAERRSAAARAPPPYHASPHSAHAQRRVAIDDFNDYT
ncbi:unnamed protein product [Colias eurytheme]|nr:unnamed protein product [Colias eurytheme]